MTLSTYEPATLEIWLTLGLGLTVLSPYYRGFARRLGLRGDEQVLDFGSGSGVCSRHVAARLRHGGHLDCVDISDRWMHVIRRTLSRFDNVGYHRGRITTLALPEAAYDMVVIHFVLHDIPAAERPDVVAALVRRLKPGGRLVLREPQDHGLTLDELDHLMTVAGLRPTSTVAHRVATMSVYNAIYSHRKELQ
jgi:ubiquinone/menaquinone biosynthesis C-methylase UbiE